MSDINREEKEEWEREKDVYVCFFYMIESFFEEKWYDFFLYVFLKMFNIVFYNGGSLVFFDVIERIKVLE